jgi:hypothetical protein
MGPVPERRRRLVPERSRRPVIRIDNYPLILEFVNLN